MSDIVERLNRGEGCLEEGGKTCISMDAVNGCLCAIAADEITRLTAEMKRLRAALNSIAANTYGYEPDVLSDEEAKNYFAGLFFDAQNKARAALSGDRHE
jgi:hypothetical protein